MRTTLLANLAANQPLVKVVTPDAAAAANQTYSDQVAAEKAKAIGTATESLCLVRSVRLVYLHGCPKRSGSSTAANTAVLALQPSTLPPHDRSDRRQTALMPWFISSSTLLIRR